MHDGDVLLSSIGNLANSPLREALVSVRQTLQSARIDSPGLSAELLLAEALVLDRAELLKLLIMSPGQPLTEEQGSRFTAFASRRASGEPAAYILGRKEFYGRDFRVTPATLIPRPETELLVESALAGLDPATPLRFADLGTGSGCIAITLALALPQATGIAVDNSPQALAVAEENALRLGAKNLRFLLADFTQPVLQEKTLDLIVSNPPYISAAEYSGLSPEVRDFEPQSALVPRLQPNSPAQATGLEHIVAVIAAAQRALVGNGRLFVEMGCEQGADALGLVSAPPWQNARVIRDLAGLDRILFAQLAPIQGFL